MSPDRFHEFPSVVHHTGEPIAGSSSHHLVKPFQALSAQGTSLSRGQGHFLGDVRPKRLDRREPMRVEVDMTDSIIAAHFLPDHRPSEDSEHALVIGLLRASSVFRGVTLLWACVGIALSTEHLAQPIFAGALVALMVITTLLVNLWPSRGAIFDPLSARTVAFELMVGAIVLIGDGLVYEDTRPQSLPWSWPAAGVMVAGILYGKRAGLLAAAFIGSASLFAEVVLLERTGSGVGALSKLALWMLTGGVAGYVVTRLRMAEAQISVIRAREEVSRQLHDGVLQTLAVIQRRSDDNELSALARDQEHDLRAFLSGSADAATEFEPEVRRLAARHESMFGGRVNVVIAGDVPALLPEQLDALCGAMGEALTNAGKHGEAEKITIYAEPADEDMMDSPTVFVSINDDGTGFDPEEVEERIGLSRSIRGRMIDAGGRAEISSKPGRGAEVRLWV